MPLPPALASKLAKRGLIAGKANNPGFVEEVIAESYDDEDEVVKTREKESSSSSYNAKGLNFDSSSLKEGKLFPDLSLTNNAPLTKFHRLGHFGCPNKTNVYHRCSPFCVSRWGRGKSQPDPIYNERRFKMLKKYPLPHNWIEIYDAGSGRYFYWDTTSDNVCWRSPRHPKAKICRPASEIRVRIIEGGEEKRSSLSTRDRERDKDRSRDFRDKDRERERDRRDDDKDREFSRESVANSLDRYKKEKERKRRTIDDSLDPMDPAAYSDIPRGKWSAGLKNETKSGVDSTATGPLFQMRPYPSPGAVLKMNSEPK